MQEVFEKIIEKLENEYEDLKETYKLSKDLSFYHTFQGVNKAIDIVKQEAEQYNEDYCEWSWKKSAYELPYEAMVHCKGDRVMFDSIRLFTYCPYCGKKIKVVE